MATVSWSRSLAFSGSFKNLPKLVIVFSSTKSILNYSSFFTRLSPRILTLAAHQLVTFFKVFSSFIVSLGLGSKIRTNPFSTSLIIGLGFVNFLTVSI